MRTAKKLNHRKKTFCCMLIASFMSFLLKWSCLNQMSNYSLMRLLRYRSTFLLLTSFAPVMRLFMQYSQISWHRSKLIRNWKTAQAYRHSDYQWCKIANIDRYLNKDNSSCSRWQVFHLSYAFFKRKSSGCSIGILFKYFLNVEGWYSHHLKESSLANFLR